MSTEIYILEVCFTDKKMVSMTQFTELLGKHCSEYNPMADMLEAFKVFDKNGDGVISVSELRQVMSNLGQSLTDRELQKMFQNADQDGDGEINFNGNNDSIYLFWFTIMLIQHESNDILSFCFRILTDDGKQLKKNVGRDYRNIPHVL